MIFVQFLDIMIAQIMNAGLMLFYLAEQTSWEFSMVANPKDRFSRSKAHIIAIHATANFLRF